MANYECKTAFNGEEALKEIENDSFDLILLDVMLPKIDGFTLLEKIKPLAFQLYF